MTAMQRQEWILEYLRKRPGASVNILDAAFVESFVEATSAKFIPQMFGAAKCPKLGQDLGALHAINKLCRVAVGLPSGDASMGFPKWVYHYSL
jgi:hypothetical protein